jgi:hypothetical protein
VLGNLFQPLYILLLPLLLLLLLLLLLSAAAVHGGPNHRGALQNAMTVCLYFVPPHRIKPVGEYQVHCPNHNPASLHTSLFLPHPTGSLRTGHDVSHMGKLCAVLKCHDSVHCPIFLDPCFP